MAWAAWAVPPGLFQLISSVPLGSLSEYATLLLVCAVGCVLVVLSMTIREDSRTERR